MNTMAEKRWWCDWYFSPSEIPYLRDDERFFFRTIVLIPSIGLLSSWPWWNNQSLFPWYYCAFWSALLAMVCYMLALSYFQSYLINFMAFLCPFVWLWHGFLLMFDAFGVDPKSQCDFETIDPFQYLFCIWPSGGLWWVILRDGYFLLVIICLLLSYYLRPAPPPVVSAPFAGRPLNPVPNLNRRGERMRSERRRRQRRRSSFVVHYVLLRVVQIRRRRRRLISIDHC